ncbi:MAG: hypothetical protein JXP34_07155, partial [Planctomycetes bacterium]|nr:hypothetical protein [Planctomycetota bacterium]
MPRRRWRSAASARASPAIGLLAILFSASGFAPASPGRQEIRLSVDPRGRSRSRSPASVEIDLGAPDRFDEAAADVVTPDGRRVPWRIDRLFGATKATLHFVLPDHTATTMEIRFDAADPAPSDPRRVPGIVGDGDRFRETWKRRAVAASHFDHFFDFDGDGDLDLFRGGVEPYV